MTSNNLKQFQIFIFIHKITVYLLILKYIERIKEITDPAGLKTEYIYDGKGNLITISTLNSELVTLNSISATYDDSDRIKTITDPMGNTSQYDYTTSSSCPTCTGGSPSIPARITDPLGNVTLLTFDSAGKVIGMKDRNNNQTSYTYDPSGRLTKITYPDSTTATYSYDERGRLLTASNINTTLTFTYDILGKVKTFTDSRLGKTITYEYDKNGNRTKMTDGEGVQTTYSYNAIGLLTGLSTLNSQLITRNFTFTYDENGRRKNRTYPNGITTTYAYDPTGNLLNLLTRTPQLATVDTNTYTYDPVGDRLTNSDLSGTHSYQYDSIYQLIQAGHPDMETEAFSYDKNGNRVTETRGNAVTGYTHTSGNRIQTRDGETYIHDNNGNIISKTDSTGTTTYEYDYANRLIKVILPDGTAAEYKYDALWRRIEKAMTVNNTTTTTRYLYDGVNILAEYDENNSLKTKYTHNIGIDDPLAMERNGNTYYYHKDALGSITAITDDSGNIVQQYQYDSFGNITYIKDQTFIQPYTYTGREYDEETGLYFYRARYYDARIGRFISEDPIGLAGGDVNFYAYVGNNPLNFTDPLGLMFRYPTPVSKRPLYGGFEGHNMVGGGIEAMLCCEGNRMKLKVYLKVCVGVAQGGSISIGRVYNTKPGTCPDLSGSAGEAGGGPIEVGVQRNPNTLVTFGAGYGKGVKFSRCEYFLIYEKDLGCCERKK